MQGVSVHPTHPSSQITLDDLAASLRLEHGDVAAALLKARDSLQEQACLQQQKEAKEAIAAAALLAEEQAKPKATPACTVVQCGHCCAAHVCFQTVQLVAAMHAPVPTVPGSMVVVRQQSHGGSAAFNAAVHGLVTPTFAAWLKA